MKIRASLCTLLALWLLCVACEKIELESASAPTEEGGSTQPDTPGTEEEGVLRVAALAGLDDGTYVCLTGYIVGYVPGRSLSKMVFGTEGAVATNVVLADSPHETDYSRCAAVQLEKDTDTREDLNLADNPDRLGACVRVWGVKQKYFAAPGLKEADAYEWVQTGEEGGTDPDEGDKGEEGGGTTAQPAAYPQLSSAPAQVLEGC